MFQQISEQNQPVFVLRTYEDVDDFITFATSATSALPTAHDPDGIHDSIYGLVYGAGAGEDSNSLDDNIRAIQREDSRNRAKARRGKRMVGGDN